MLLVPRELLEREELRLNPPELPNALLRSKPPDDMLRLDMPLGLLGRDAGRVLALGRFVIPLPRSALGRFEDGRLEGPERLLKLFDGRELGLLPPPNLFEVFLLE